MINHETIIHIVDDNVEVARSLGLLFNSINYQTKIYLSAQEYLSTHSQNISGCLIIDVSMPDMTGLELVEKLNENLNYHPIIMLTGTIDLNSPIQALRLRVREFILKPYNNEYLINLVTKICAETHAQQLLCHKYVKNIKTITEKENAVIQLAIAGKPNKVIADLLNVSIATVEQRRARYMRKMELNSFIDLMNMHMAVTTLLHKKQTH